MHFLTLRHENPAEFLIPPFLTKKKDCAVWQAGEISHDRYKIEESYTSTMARVFRADRLTRAVKMAIDLLPGDGR